MSVGALSPGAHRPAGAPGGASEPGRPDRVVERARAGERGAIALLYRQHAPRLRRYFYCRRGGRVQQAEGLTAEVFVRTLERLDGYCSVTHSLSGGENPGGYVPYPRTGRVELRRRCR